MFNPSIIFRRLNGCRSFGTSIFAANKKLIVSKPETITREVEQLKPSKRIVSRKYVDLPNAPFSLYFKAFVIAFAVGFGLELMMCRSGFYEHEVKKMLQQHEEEQELEARLDEELAKLRAKTPLE